MKLEVGMYARYEGRIGKYKGYTGNDRGELYTYDFTTFEIDSDDEESEIVRLYCLKVSFNLIDLIEVGDYVNGEKVQEDNFGNLITISSFASNGMFNTIESYGSKIKNEDIEEILTHEQYEANCYKVVE
jgi:hypothetical protein